MRTNKTQFPLAEYLANRGVKVDRGSRRCISASAEGVPSSIAYTVRRLSPTVLIEEVALSKPISSDVLKEIPDEVLIRECLKGKRQTTLDLTPIEDYWMRKRAEAGMSAYLGREAPAASEAVGQDKVRQLLDILREERAFLETLLEKPDTTIDEIFRALLHGVEKFKGMGFHATIFRPIKQDGLPPEESRWRELFRAESWGEGGYSGPDGEFPKGTLLGVIKSRRSKFDVNLEDEESFRRQGLCYDREKIEYDRQHSKGSPERLIRSLKSLNGKPEAIIYVDNRVSRNALDDPPLNLFPPKDAPYLEEELNSYFDHVAQAINQVNERTVKPAIPSGPDAYLSPDEKAGILLQGQLIEYRGQRVRIIEAPSEKLYTKRPGVIKWWRDTILKVYEGTEIAKGKTKEQLIKDLSLEDGDMEQRVFYVPYVALPEGDPPNEHDLKGVLSGTVLDINHGGPGVVFKVPESMIRKDARGRKMEVKIVYEMTMRVIRKRWAEMGFIKGFFHMLTRGLPIYATTQSYRVICDMLRSKDLSVLRIARGKELSDEQKKIIRVGSQGKADERGVERDAYGGRIAIDEEEKGIVVRRPHLILNLPVIRSIFRGYHERIRKENAEIQRLLNEELGERGRLHLVGYVTIGVALKVRIELLLAGLLRNLFPKTYARG